MHKEYNIKCHYTTRHAEEDAKYHGEEREDRVPKLKACLLRQQDFFNKASKESDVAAKASYVVTEMIAKAESHSEMVGSSNSACYRLQG